MCNLVVFLNYLCVRVRIIIHLDDFKLQYIHTQLYLDNFDIFFYESEDRRLPAIGPIYGVVFPTTMYCLPTTIIPTIF